MQLAAAHGDLEQLRDGHAATADQLRTAEAAAADLQRQLRAAEVEVGETRRRHVAAARIQSRWRRHIGAWPENRSWDAAPCCLCGGADPGAILGPRRLAADRPHPRRLQGAEGRPAAAGRGGGGEVRCPRLQLGAPACACRLELVPLTGASDHRAGRRRPSRRWPGCRARTPRRPPACAGRTRPTASGCWTTSAGWPRRRPSSSGGSRSSTTRRWRRRRRRTRDR